MSPTLIVTTASNASVQVPTLRAALSPDRDFDTVILWSEQLFGKARSANNDCARFISNMVSR
jgi:hypothetical protein